MWAEAAKTIARFRGVVVTAVDADGYPVSVRVSAPRYDGASGELPVSWPDSFGVTAGPAVLLCHSHNRKLWNIKIAQVKGRLEQRTAGWVFITTAFTPPVALLSAFWALAK